MKHLCYSAKRHLHIILLILLFCINTINTDDNTNKEIGFSTNEHFKGKIVPWMQNLSDKLLISSIAIPGTHDSGTANINNGQNNHFYDRFLLEKHGRTQSLPIIQQLNVGVRFFDIRVFHDGTIVHGIFSANTDFVDLISEAKSFLEKYKTEGLIFRIKYEGFTNIIFRRSEKEFEAFLTKILEEHKTTFLITEVIPKVAQIRGKIWLIAQNMDFIKTLNWENKNVIHLQDFYQEHNPLTKIGNILDHQKTITRLNNLNKFSINFFSASPLANGKIFTESIQKMAKSVNDVAYDFKFPTNIIVFDFPSQNVIKTIYKLNRVFPKNNRNYGIALFDKKSNKYEKCLNYNKKYNVQLLDTCQKTWKVELIKGKSMKLSQNDGRNLNLGVEIDENNVLFFVLINEVSIWKYKVKDDYFTIYKENHEEEGYDIIFTQPINT